MVKKSPATSDKNKMPPEPVSLAATVAITAMTQAVKRIVDDAYDGVKDVFAKKIKELTQTQRIKKLINHLSSVRLVKTIWQVDKEVDLHAFYHPTNVMIDKDTSVRVRSLDELGKAQCIVFQGIVGQGKSMFLRHLACQELLQGNRVPLFVELRRLTSTSVVGNATEPTPLLAGILSKMKDLGFDADLDLFERLAAKGLIVLMLDAFDELAADCVVSVINEMESLHFRFPKLQIIVTSRPDAPVSRIALFRVYNIAYISRGDIAAFVDRLVSDHDLCNHIMGAVQQAEHIRGILITPLMVTLMVISFRARNSLPESLSGFYENLVPILLARHDQTKPGFTRVKACNLSDHRIREVFEALCFVSKRKFLNKSTMSDREVHECAVKAIDIARISCDESAFVQDIVKVTCLLLEDGGLYSFLHKSVQEFGAATFIRRLRTESVIRQYDEFLGGNWRYWSVELEFLAEIDSYRFNRHFLLKDLERTVAYCFTTPVEGKLTGVSEGDIRKFLKLLLVVEIANEDKPPLYYTIPDQSTGYSYSKQWYNVGIPYRVADDVIKRYKETPDRPVRAGLPGLPAVCNYEDLLDAGLVSDSMKKAAASCLLGIASAWEDVIKRIAGVEEGEEKAFVV